MVLDVVRKALGRHSDRVFVHPVGPYAHDSPESSGTEFEIAVERILERGGIIVPQCDDLALGFGVEIPFDPPLCNFLIIFHIG